MLGVDFNGYHALAGLLLFAPAFYFALKPTWALYYAIVGAAFFAAVALIQIAQDRTASSSNPPRARS